jgi:hypothetical protein
MASYPIFESAGMIFFAMATAFISSFPFHTGRTYES